MDEEVKHGDQAMAEEGNIVCSGKYRCLIIRLQRKEDGHLLRKAKIPKQNAAGADTISP